MYIARSTALDQHAHNDLVADNLDELHAQIAAKIAQIADDDEQSDALKAALIEVLAASMRGHPDVILIR